MNEVSIIINGVRYDAEKRKFSCQCEPCDLFELCFIKGHGMKEICTTLSKEPISFKKSTKSFEP